MGLTSDEESGESATVAFSFGCGAWKVEEVAFLAEDWAPRLAGLQTVRAIGYR